MSKVEDTGKNEVYLRLSTSLVKNHVTDETDELKVEVQFQLNRIPSCEMHSAVDGLQDLDLVCVVCDSCEAPGSLTQQQHF